MDADALGLPANDRATGGHDGTEGEFLSPYFIVVVRRELSNGTLIVCNAVVDSIFSESAASSLCTQYNPVTQYCFRNEMLNIRCPVLSSFRYHHGLCSLFVLVCCQQQSKRISILAGSALADLRRCSQRSPRHPIWASAHTLSA